MNLKRTPPAIASAAAEEIRALNHRTLDPKAFGQPGDVSDVVNALAVLLERLPQALQQADAGLQQLHDAQAIRLDDKPPGETSQNDITDRVHGIRYALQQAQHHLGEAHSQLRNAAGPLSHMGGLWEDVEE